MRIARQLPYRLSAYAFWYRAARRRCGGIVPLISTAPEPDVSAAHRSTLARDVAIVLAVKVVLLLCGWWLFFSPDHRPDITPDSLQQHLGPPVDAPGDAVDPRSGPSGPRSPIPEERT